MNVSAMRGGSQQDEDDFMWIREPFLSVDNGLGLIVVSARRAQTLARGSGSAVGGLVSASQGVFQIVSRGSTSSSDYGEYDTGAIEKTARVVVTLEYAVR